MRNQLYWVALTYVRRPLFWVATAVLLAAVVHGISTSNSEHMRQSYPRIKVSGVRVHSYRKFQKLQSEGRLHELRTLDISRLLGEKEWERAREINAEKLTGKCVLATESVDIDEINTRELIEEIALATNIEELEFTGILPDLDLSWLSQFPKLRHFKVSSLSGNKPWVAQLDQLLELQRLSISSCKSIEGISRLANLKKFQTLELDSIHEFSDEDLREIAQLPHLQTLILKPHSVASAPKSDDPKNSVTDAGLALLRDMPNLRTVYVNRYALVRVRSALPNKRVLRANYSNSRMGYLALLEIALGLFFAVTLFHFTGQSSLFLGRLAPGFLRSHLLIPIGMIVIAVALGTFCIVTRGGGLLPALSVCLLMLAGLALLFHLFPGREVIPFLGLAPSVIGLVQKYFNPTIDSYLLGDYPGVCLALLGLACLTIFVVSRSLVRLPIRLAESGKVLPVHLADIKSLAEAKQTQSGRTHWPMRIFSNALDRQLSSGFHGHQQTKRISLWHAATQGAGRSQGMFFWALFCTTVFFSIMRKRPEPETLLALAILAPLTIGVLTLFGSAASWHFRLKHFSYELLRPVSRRSLRSDFLRSLIGNLGNSLLLTLPLAMIVYVYYRNANFEIIPWIPSLCFLSVGGLIFVAGVAVSIALIRRSWLAMSALFLLYMLSIPTLSFGFFAEDWVPTTSPLAIVALGLGLLGTAALVFAWRRFLHIEWGKSV